MSKSQANMEHLTTHQIYRIRADLLAGRTLRQLARKYGVKERTIQMCSLRSEQTPPNIFDPHFESMGW